MKSIRTGKVTYDKYGGQYFWINLSNTEQQMLAEMRGWGAIQNRFKQKDGTIDKEKAGKFQDKIGDWIAEAINEKLEREAEQLKISSNPPAIKSVCPECNGKTTRINQYEICTEWGCKWHGQTDR